MSLSKPIAALAAGCLLIERGRSAQSDGAAQSPANAGVQALDPDGTGTVDWIERSDVAALAKGSSRRWSSRSACRSRRAARSASCITRSPS